MPFKKLTLFTLVITSLVFSSCKKDEENIPSKLDDQLEDALSSASNGLGKAFYKMPTSTNLRGIPQDPKNPLTEEKVALGKLLFYETGLSISPLMPENKGEYSCASCHIAAAGYQSNLVQGIGEGGQGFGINGEGRTKDPNFEESMMDVSPVRVPSILNNAYQQNLFWNGMFGATGVNRGTESLWLPETPMGANNLGYEGVETQAIAGLVGHRLNVNVDPTILAELGYTEMFDAAFGDLPEDQRYNGITTGLAIAAYERTILANQAPFQKYVHGDLNALTEEEKRGAILFFDEAGCASCHNGAGLNNLEFHAIGMKDLKDNPQAYNVGDSNPGYLGRGGFTGNSEDNYKFKVPQLYNLKDAPFLGHGCSIGTVEDMVRYKNLGVSENSDVPNTQLAEDFTPLNLTDEQVSDIAAFVNDGLYDPNLSRYVPGSLPSGNCFPTSDPIAKDDLGCN